ncbi:MAG: tetratricopeptide repeat protein [Flavobacteriaceae bacterium]
MKKQVLFIALLVFSFAFSQTKEQEVLAKENQELLSKAQKNIEEGDFASAEAKYRKVIGSDPKNTEAKYNLGNLYYRMGKNKEAQKRYIQAIETAQSKSDKHKMYHNLGNVFMNEKQYRPAVEAYKNALRNNPTDDETRYNLALAKKMLEEHGDSGGGSDDQNEENQDEKQEGDNEEEQDKGDEGEDEQNSPEKDEEGEPKKPEQGEEEGTPQPREGKLSPQQIKSLLEAMNNEEKKVQDKINAEKQKGAKIKPEKDW